MGALVGLEAFRGLAQINLYTGLVTFPLLVFGSIYFGVEGAVWGLISASAINWLLNQVAIRREGRIAGIAVSVRDCLKEWEVLSRFSLPAVLSGMLAAPVNWLCNTILISQTGGYSEMGIVNATNQWFFALLLFPGILVRNTMPILTERFAHNDKRGCKELLRYSVKLNAVLVLPIVLLGCVTSRHIMGLYGKEFQSAWLALVISIVTSGVLAIDIPIGLMTAATGRMWSEIVMNLAWASIFYFGTWWLSPWGALGLVTARLVAYGAHAIWTTAFAIWVLKDSDFSVA
jgi:O-antigen/teichoic acid export membrane protein